VGDKLFRLHRSLLCQDPESLFKSLFSLPKPESTKATQGPSELVDPEYIPIPDVDPKVFAVLAQMVYARAAKVPMDNPALLPIGDWISFFEMADRFCMESMIQYAVKIITSIPVQSMDGELSSRFLHLTNRFTASFTLEYRDSIFRHILARTDSLSEQEMELLGHGLSARISRLREKLRERPQNLPSKPCACDAGDTSSNTKHYCQNCGIRWNSNSVGYSGGSDYGSLSVSAKQHSLTG